MALRPDGNPFAGIVRGSFYVERISGHQQGMVGENTALGTSGALANSEEGVLDGTVACLRDPTYQMGLAVNNRDGKEPWSRPPSFP